jgi:hypothetical protein
MSNFQIPLLAEGEVYVGAIGDKNGASCEILDLI